MSTAAWVELTWSPDTEPSWLRHMIFSGVAESRFAAVGPGGKDRPTGTADSGKTRSCGRGGPVSARRDCVQAVSPACAGRAEGAQQVAPGPRDTGGPQSLSAQDLESSRVLQGRAWQQPRYGEGAATSSHPERLGQKHSPGTMGPDGK